MTAPGPTPHSLLMAPSLGLSSCVRSYIVRSTLDCTLEPGQRFNHFPASPLCGIFWLIEGSSWVVRRGGDDVAEPVPRISFAGPHTVPMVSLNPGPVQAFMLGLLPQALQALTGIDLASLVNRVVSVEEALGADWHNLCQQVLRANDDAVRIRCIEAFLAPRWHALQHGAIPRTERYRHWTEALALKAYTSGVGQSLRQAERRFKRWVGLPLRELRRLGRTEELFILARGTDFAAERTPRDWAGMAADSGFSDQAHLCREVRRVTGLSPQQLERAIEEDESFWLYRIWT